LNERRVPGDGRRVASGEALPIERIFGQDEELDLERDLNAVDEMAGRAGDGLETDLRFEAERGTHRVGHLQHRLSPGIDDEIDIACGPDHAVSIAGKRAHKHVGDADLIERADRGGDRFGAGHHRPLRMRSIRAEISSRRRS